MVCVHGVKWRTQCKFVESYLCTSACAQWLQHHAPRPCGSWPTDPRLEPAGAGDSRPANSRWPEPAEQAPADSQSCADGDFGLSLVPCTPRSAGPTAIHFRTARDIAFARHTVCHAPGRRVSAHSRHERARRVGAPCPTAAVGPEPLQHVKVPALHRRTATSCQPTRSCGHGRSNPCAHASRPTVSTTGASCVRTRAHRWPAAAGSAPTARRAQLWYKKPPA